MNKLEYLNKLETILRREHLSKTEIDDIIRDYAEFFEEGRRQGQSDGEICAKLGSPELVAQQILEEDGHNVALAATTPRSGPRFDFRFPHWSFSWPHWERKPKEEQDKEPRQPREPRPRRQQYRRSGGFGSALSFLVKALILCFVVPCCALVIGCAVIGLGCVLLGLLAAFVAVIVSFFAASICSTFLGVLPILFVLCLCVCLLGLIVCLGALCLMALWACLKGAWKLGEIFLGWLFHSEVREPLAQPAYAQPYGPASQPDDFKEEENHD